MREGYGLAVAGRDLKDLFRAHAAGDELAFRRAANSLITEEEARSHVALARDLRKILVGGDGVAAATDIIRLPDPPTDRDGGWPLAEVRRPDRYFSDLVLVGRTEGQLREPELARLTRQTGRRRADNPVATRNPVAATDSK